MTCCSCGAVARWKSTRLLPKVVVRWFCDPCNWIDLEKSMSGKLEEELTTINA